MYIIGGLSFWRYPDEAGTIWLWVEASQDLVIVEIASLEAVEAKSLAYVNDDFFERL